jgi:tetratricopeptide (TPR) repeat protein
MTARSVMLLAMLLVAAQRWTAHVSGRVCYHDGRPLVDAEITYKNVGQFGDASAVQTVDLNGEDPLGEVNANSGTGRVYKTKTDGKGHFEIMGVAFGVYAVEITDSSGKHVYLAKKRVGDNTDKRVSNILNVDLPSTVPGLTADDPDNEGTNREGLVRVREEHAGGSKINRLISQLHRSLDAQAWNQSADLLRQLLALDPNRWEFYQNLGTLQSNSGHYQEAVEVFQKGVAVAEKTLATAPDQAQAKADISGMMIAQGDARLRMGEQETAVALYQEASRIAPHPGMAYLRVCSAQADRGMDDEAIDACNRAISADPNRWDFYQVLGAIEDASGKPADALATYERGMQAARKELASNPNSARTRNSMGQMLNAEGELYSKLGRQDEAIVAFSESARLAVYAALPYFNLCATYYDVKRMPEAVAACNQAIASEPSMADAYYIKAGALFAKSLEGQDRASLPETRAMLNKYLEFAPFGRYAQAAREMLDKLDSTDDTGAKKRKPAAK